MRSARSKKNPPCGRPVGVASAPPSPARFERWQAELRRYLESAGLKYSEQRWKLAQLVLSSPDHLSAQQIVQRVAKEYPDIGAATVYRNIKVLCDAKILRETLVDAEGRVVYEAFDEGHHDHIVCLDCGGIFEFHEEKIESLQRDVAKRMSFAEASHRHVIYARCTYGSR